MKVIIVHGDDITKSYQRLMLFFDEAKKRNWEIKSIDEADTSISEVISSVSLFSEERFFIVKDIKLVKPKDIEFINKKMDNLQGNLVIYANKSLPVTFIKSFKKIHKEEVYNLSKILFKFVDTLVPGNTTNAIKVFQELKKSEPAELVFSIVAKHFRDLFWVKADEASLNYPSWRLSKIKSIANKFEENKLKEIINNLSEMDVKSKTGEADLTEELDLLILTKLE